MSRRKRNRKGRRAIRMIIRMNRDQLDRVRRGSGEVGSRDIGTRDVGTGSSGGSMGVVRACGCG